MVMLKKHFEFNFFWYLSGKKKDACKFFNQNAIPAANWKHTCFFFGLILFFYKRMLQIQIECQKTLMHLVKYTITQIQL